MNTTKENTMTTSTLLTRKSAKQSWAQAAKTTMLDSPERLEAWTLGMNQDLGWNKYAVLETPSEQPTVVSVAD